MSISDTTIPHQPTRIGRWVMRLFSLLTGTLLSLTAPSSLILLGWLMRQTRTAAFRRAGLDTVPTGWVFDPSGRGLLQRVSGGLAANIREGILAALSLFLATLPFAAAWIFSWWAGWENSFSKGYEQAFVGTALGLSGMAIFALTMIYLPMALAHQAVESRAFALFEFRQVKSAVRNSGWRYIFLAAVTVFFALPIFGGRIMMVLAEQFIPGLADFTPQQISDLQLLILLAKGVYVFVSLTILRRWAGRIYADAVLRAHHGKDRALWENSPLTAASAGQPLKAIIVARLLRYPLLIAIWLGFAVQLYIAQFMNHSWVVWITHPYTFLPWVI